MKILPISPATKGKMMGSTFAFRFPFINLYVLAAYTPKDADIKIIDERIDEINFDEACDLVGITVMTPVARRAYQIADEFRKKGVKVVMGGMPVGE